ncbi:MAG: hypothetical protein GY906_37645 [bacterium]|nr:hypothetical protein [bacterium]
MTTVGTIAIGARRRTLDDLVAQVLQPGFVARYRRMPSCVESSGHVSAPMLEISPPRSRYVRRWKRHARRCEQCRETFRYYGLSVK